MARPSLRVRAIASRSARDDPTFVPECRWIDALVVGRDVACRRRRQALEAAPEIVNVPPTGNAAALNRQRSTESPGRLARRKAVTPPAMQPTR
jgi:hypothetical protein